MSTTTSTNAKPLEQLSSKHSSFYSFTSDESSYYSQSSCDAYLKHDVTTERELSVENFAQFILGCDDWAESASSKEVHEISEDSVFKSLLSVYNDTVEEVDLFPCFCELANHVLKKGSGEESNRMTFSQSHLPSKSRRRAARKPQVIISDSGAASSRVDLGSTTPPFSWKDVLGYVEFRLKADRDEWATAYGYSSPEASGSGSDNGTQPSNSGRTSGSSNKRRRSEEWSESSSKRCRGKRSGTKAKLRCAGYALEMILDGVRTHALGFYMNKDNLYLHYFDRSIFVSSKSFSLTTDPKKFITLLLTLQRLDDSQWGFMPGFNRQKPLRLTLSKEWQLEFSSIVSQQRTLIGRGTVVVRGCIVKAPDGDKDQLIATKISSPPRTRRSERDILQLAYDMATGGFEKMLDHLPKIHHCEDIDLGAKSPQERLSVFFKEKVYESRALRVMAFRELRPIQELIVVDELATAFRDVFNCYRWLFEEVKILHRDVSLYNIMYYRKDGKVCGVLNDFDLATFAGDTSPSSKQRTGTRPFMAYELLLYNRAHLYRHDLESLFYVILILTSHFDNGKEIESPPLKSWFTLDPSTLGALKSVLLVIEPLPSPTPPYTAFKRWLDPMREMFKQVPETAREVVDEETLGGAVTFDRMASILSVELCNDTAS